MDFEDSPHEAAFRAEARAWLAANAPEHEGAPRDAEEEMAMARAWQRRKARDGWACIAWPQEYGGRGASLMETIIFEQEESRYAIPHANLGIGTGTCAPALMAHASDEIKRRHLPKIASAEEVWCQLFSEPGAGSDLAGIRTRAERQGDEWLVNGQKVWNTNAHCADYAILVIPPTCRCTRRDTRIRTGSRYTRKPGPKSWAAGYRCPRIRPAFRNPWAKSWSAFIPRRKLTGPSMALAGDANVPPGQQSVGLRANRWRWWEIGLFF